MPDIEPLTLATRSPTNIGTVRGAHPAPERDLRGNETPSVAVPSSTLANDDPLELRALRKQLLRARSRLSRVRLQQEAVLLRRWAVRGRQVTEIALMLWSARQGWLLLQRIRLAQAASSPAALHAQPSADAGNPMGFAASSGAGNRLAIELVLGVITTLARLVKGWRRAAQARGASPER